MDNVVIFLAIVPYLIIAYQIVVLDKPHNFASWMMWLILDFVIIGSCVHTHTAVTRLLLVFTIGTAVIALILLLKKRFSVGNKEVASAGLVALCIVLYFTASPLAALFAASLATGIAGIPFLIDLYNDGSDRLTRWYTFFFLAGSLMTLGSYVSPESHLEDFVFPGVCTTYWILASGTAQLRRAE